MPFPLYYRWLENKSYYPYTRPCRNLYVHRHTHAHTQTHAHIDSASANTNKQNTHKFRETLTRGDI